MTTLLFLQHHKNAINDEFSNLVPKMIETYLNYIKIEKSEKNINLKPKFALNHLIPGFYNFYKILSDFINDNIRNDFIKNEKKIRFYLNMNKFDIKQNYYKKEEDFLSLTYHEIENDKFVSEFINKIPSNILLYDYITFFLTEFDSDKGFENIFNYNNVSSNDCKHELINLLLNIRFNESKKVVEKNKNDSLKLIFIKINWIISNRDYIIKILKIFNILEKIFEENEYIKILKETLNKEKLRYITNEKKNPDITIEVNECYYKILASICYSIIPPYINFTKKIELYDYIETIKSAMKIIKSLNDELLTYSIEVELIEELIQIYDILELNGKMNYDILNEICMSLKNNNEILRKNKEIQADELIDEYKNLYEILKKSLKYTDKKYYELLKYIFFKETKKVPNVRYRAAIFQDVIKDAEILVNSNDILQILLRPLVNPDITIFPKSIKSIEKSTDYDIVIIIENILENENEEIYNALSETLLYYFEKNSLMYFKNLFHNKEKIFFDNKDENPIVGPLKLFKDCIKFLNNYNKENSYKNNSYKESKNKNLNKLFCIAYIKTYCYTFIDLFESNNPIFERQSQSNIIKEINNAKSLNQIISFYILKLIYYKNNENIDIFIDPEFINKYKFNEYKCFQNINLSTNPFNYNYNNQKNKEIYEQFCSVLEKYKDTNFEDIEIGDFNKIKTDIDIFYFSTYNLILSHLKKISFLDSPIYKNFYKNVCIPLFKNKDKIFDAIKLLYDPQKFIKLTNEYELNKNNLSIFLHSYRYFINEINSNTKNNIYSVFYNRKINLKKINDYFYPGNDIKNIPIYSIYSKIKNHFNETPYQGCFVCLCNKGGFYHIVKGGRPGHKYLNLKCKNCGKKIGAEQNERGFIKRIKSENQNYYRIFPTKEIADKESQMNNGSYNCMGFDEFKKKYIYKEFEKERGITYSDKNFFKKNTKIVRFLSNISYRILNFILYSHLFFSKIYNSNQELDVFLPENMNWIKVITECWEMIKMELNKLGISSINIFMNYIFLDLFSILNTQKSLTEYNMFIEFEDKLDKLIIRKVVEFKEEYKKMKNLTNFDSKDKSFFQNMIEERYTELNQDDYPFYKYFYYIDYIKEEYLINILNHQEKDRFPVLLKVLEKNNVKNNQTKYSLDNLPIFNNVLNLFNDTYFNSIKREKANIIKLKNEEIYNNNRSLIKSFINFYNSLQLKSEDNDDIILKLSEESKLSDFFIDDDNEIGKSYKYIYNQFINEQNNEISDLLQIKIRNGIFEKNCDNKINIQSANINEIFITNLPEKFSFIETIFNSSYRKFAITKDYNEYNVKIIDLETIEDKMTDLLLKNKKLFNDSIISFIYANEDLEFENKDIITIFNNEYEIENIKIEDKEILFKLYNNNKENQNLFKTIFNDFIQLIIFLNKNKILLKEEKKNSISIKDDSRIDETFKDLGEKVSKDFKEIFEKKDNFTINKTTYLFEYFRNLILGMVKLELKDFQYDLEENQKNLIETCFKEQGLITKEKFIFTLRSFIVLFLNLVGDKENKIRGNQNNMVNYFDIPDIWDKSIYNNENFKKELDNMKKINVKINQIVYLYDFLGDNINDDYFQDVKKVIEKEKELKKREQKEEIPPQNNVIPSNIENVSEESSSDENSEEDDFGDRDYV